MKQAFFKSVCFSIGSSEISCFTLLLLTRDKLTVFEKKKSSKVKYDNVGEKFTFSRWAEMMCREDFSLDDIKRAHRSKPDSPPKTVVCELHFEKDENLDYRTNLTLEPKPHRNCPPGFTPKANPVPKKWIEAAIKNLNNPFIEKVIDYKNKTKLCEIKQVSQPKITGSLKIIVESVPPNFQSDPNQENFSIQKDYFQERHVQEFPDEQPEKVSEIGISNPNPNQDIKSQEVLDDDNDIIMKNETSSGSVNSNDSEIIPESFEKIYFKKNYYVETLLQRKYEVSRNKVIIPNDDYEEIFGSGEYQSPDYKSGAIRIVLKSDLKKALKNNENIPFREKIIGYINKSSLTFEDQIGKEVIKKWKLERPETNILQIHDVQDENIEEQNTQEIPTQQESYRKLEIGVQSVQDQSADKKIIQKYNLLEKQELEKGPNIVTEKSSVLIIDKQIGILGGKTYSRKLHSTATRPDNDIEIKLKLLKSFLDKPVVFDSTVDNNLKVTNQVLRKSLSNLLEIQRKSK